MEISRQWRRLVSANVYRRGAVTVTIYLSRITRAALVAGELWNIRVAAMRHISYTIIARINRDAATQQRHRLRRPAVVGNRSEVQRRGRGVEQIAGGRRDSGTARVADQVVAVEGHRPSDAAGQGEELGAGAGVVNERAVGADGVAGGFEREQAISKLLDGRLSEIDNALAQLDSGTYGVCKDCTKPIPPRRLEALPFATMCVNCQSLADKRSHRRVAVR